LNFAEILIILELDNLIVDHHFLSELQKTDLNDFLPKKENHELVWEEEHKLMFLELHKNGFLKRFVGMSH
jgi:hypothetical protein